MERWSKEVRSRLTACAKDDPYHRMILRKCEISEAGYLQTINKLSVTDRERVEAYIALCEELVWAEVQLAYMLGSSDRGCG